MDKNIPIYEISFDELESVFNNVSIVTRPAIEVGFIQLSKDEKVVKLKIDESKREISGPVLLPEQLVYRNDGNSGSEYYIKFSKETIEQMVINFFKNHRNTAGNVEHTFNVNGINFFESYIINKERGINPKEFENLPDGTWMLSAKVENDEVWNAIKSGELTGFSIDVENVQFKPEPKKVMESIEELLDYLNNN